MKYLFSIAMIAVMIVSCSSDDVGGKNDGFKEIELSASAKEINTAANDFAVRFACEAFKASEGNTLVAPFSMQMALSMLANGAYGNTLAEILKALDFGDKGIAEVNEYNKTMWQSLNTADPSAKFFLANGYWGRDVSDEYARRMKEFFDAEVANVNLRSEQGIGVINDYFKTKTGGLIDNVVNNTMDADGLIINAAYFKNKWKTAFNKSDTKPADFLNSDGTTSKVDMMHQTNTLAVADGKTYVYVELPFGNGAYSMDIVLPYNEKAMAETIAEILSDGLPSDSAFKETEVNLGLPKFEVSLSCKANGILQNMGIRDAFLKNAASLPYIFTEQSYVGNVLQKCKMQVDEDGAVAAATTTIEVVHYSMDSPGAKTRTIIAKHPFLYMIREKSTGAILFMGRMENMN